MGENLVEIAEKKALGIFQKYVPKVFSGFEKWTFINVHFFVRGVLKAKKT